MPEMPLSMSVSSCEMAILDGVLYVSPSRNRYFGDKNYEFFKYDPWLDHWILLKPMLEPRNAFPLVSLDGKLIATGGDEDLRLMIPGCHFLLNTVEIFDPKRNSWCPAAPLPKKLVNHAAASISKKLFVSGGSSPSGKEGSFELVKQDELLCYDLQENSWSYKERMSRSHSDHQLVAHEDHLYQFGGTGRRDILECYDTLTDTWTVLDKIFTDPAPAFQFNMLSAACVEDQVYIFYESQPSVRPSCGRCKTWYRYPMECETCNCRTVQFASFNHKNRKITNIHVLAKFNHVSNLSGRAKHVVTLDIPFCVSKYAKVHIVDRCLYTSCFPY
jgi:hypothetical protein